MDRAKSNSGRKDNQKMKPYLVYQYLLRHTDENHVVTAESIANYIKTFGISAERRSIYRDVDAINDAIWLLDNKDDYDFDEGFESVLEDAKSSGYYECAIEHNKKGFYVARRKYDASQIRLISECIYSSKYISQRDAEELVDVIKEFVSDDEASEIRNNAMVCDRVKTLNKSTLANIDLINIAISKLWDGAKHIPEKISFQYLKYDITNLNQQIERTKDKTYIVSPYKMIINDGNYYLLAYSDEWKKITTFRVDKIKSLKLLGIPREGEEEFKKINLATYTQRTFSMYSGKEEHVVMSFDVSLLDAVVEKFGVKNATYNRSSDKSFTVSVIIEVSKPFYGWLCGFGDKVRIVAPQNVRDEFVSYVENIRNIYNS